MMEVLNLPELTFDERRHIYKLNGVALPSVTTVMKPLSGDVYGNIDKAILDRAAKRGTAVHNAIENYVKFGIEDIPPEHDGYFNGFLDWFKEHKVVPYGTEVKLYHKSLLYAGTADMLAQVDGVDRLWRCVRRHDHCERHESPFVCHRKTVHCIANCNA